MKVRALLVFAFAIVAMQYTHAQWFYDFGTGTGSLSNGNSTTLAPQPTPSPDAGNDYARVSGTTGSGGVITLANPGSTLGEGTELSATASSSGTSATKFSIFDYTAGKTFFTRFLVRFDNSSAGEWMFFQGDGVNYSSTASIGETEIFAGLRFSFGAAGAITIARRTNLLSWVDLASQPITQGNDYLIEILGNNSTSTENYDYPTMGPQSIAPNTYDVWVGGVLVGDDLPKASMADDVDIDSYMFYGVNSAANDATIIVDNIRYSNSIALNVLPVKFSAISASERSNGIQIDWTTYSEMNVDHYELERSSNGTDYTSLGSITSHNSVERKQYSYLDASPLSSTSYYRVRSFDRDGKQLLSPIVRVGGKQSAQLTLFPNPVRDQRLSLQVSSLIQGTFELKIHNSAGQQLYRERIVHNGGSFNHGIQLPQNLRAGVYSVQLVSEETVITRSFIIEK